MTADDPLSSELTRTQARNNRVSSLVRRHGARLRAYLRRRVADVADAEDLLQDTWAALLAADETLEPIDNIGAWLLRVLRNRLIDRSRRSRPLLGADLAALSDRSSPRRDDESATGDWLDAVPSTAAGPEADYARELWIDAVEAALTELPEPQRRVFVAHEFEGRDFASLARQWNEPINTLLSRKHAAVKSLRAKLEHARVDLELEGEL